MTSLRSYAAAAAGTVMNILHRGTPALVYVVERENWAVRSVGTFIGAHLKKDHQLPVHLSTTARGARRQLVHFGSIDTYLTATGWRSVHPSNRVITTIFHVSPAYRQTHLLARALAQATVHTTNQLTRHQLIAAGVPEAAIRVIPLGVDTALFHPRPSWRRRLRRQWNIDDAAIVIGSFQKDGVGWGAGDAPKLIKGPDLFVETVAQLQQEFPVHVLLAGPARGYVMRQLSRRRIPFTYAGYYTSLQRLAPLYAALDLYLITARVEGGPLQLLEAWASGTPLVATPVGMVLDIAHHNLDCKIAPADPAKLAVAAAELLKNQPLRESLVSRGETAAVEYDWSAIARRYFTELYQSPHTP